MLDQQIITRDANVLKACHAQLQGMAEALERNLQQMRGQLQNASNVAIDNHIRHLAMRQVLEKPLFTIFGIRIGRRRPTVRDLDDACAQIKRSFGEQSKAKQPPATMPHDRG